MKNDKTAADVTAAVAALETGTPAATGDAVTPETAAAPATTAAALTITEKQHELLLRVAVAEAVDATRAEATAAQAAAVEAATAAATKGYENPWDGVIAGWSFKPAAASAKTYEENGRKSRKLATVLFALRGLNHAKLEGKVNGVEQGGKRYAEVMFFAAQNKGQAVKTDDPGDMRMLEALKKRVLTDYFSWKKAGGGSLAGSEAGTVAFDEDVF